MGVAGLRGTGKERVHVKRAGHWTRAEVTCPNCAHKWRATWLDGTIELQCHACAVWVDVGVASTRKGDM